MQFKAKARNPGECALRACTLPAARIFISDKHRVRVLCCTTGHAQAVARELDTLATGHTTAQLHAAIRAARDDASTTTVYR